MFQIFVMFILARLLLANPSTVASVAQLSKSFMQSSNFRNSMLGDHAIFFPLSEGRDSIISIDISCLQESDLLFELLEISSFTKTYEI